MRQVLLITFGTMIAVAIMVALFTLDQADREQVALQSQLQARAQSLSASLSESIEPPLSRQATSSVQNVVERFVGSQRLSGLEVFDSHAAAVASSTMPADPDPDLIASAMDGDEAGGQFVSTASGTFYILASPLHNDGGQVIGALALAQNADYIEGDISDIWRYNLLRLLLQLVFFGAAIFALMRWVFFKPISRFAASLESIRKGEDGADLQPAGSMFAPLTREVSKITSSLRQARRAASEEARMRLEQLDSPWTAERLKEFVKIQLKNRPLYVLSNREPYVHSAAKGNVSWSVPAGGVVTALNPVMEACGGTWIAHGSGDADRETADQDGKLKVPPDEPRYTLKRIWLSPEELKGYYDGFSNEALWPLCHMAHVRPIFRREDWLEYRKVNGLFAAALLQEIRRVERPVILVQDYHLALVPALIKKSRPDAQVVLFWHIPWPSAAQFSICPWRAELLDGILGADLIGFHTQQHSNNFLDTVGAELEARIDFEHFSVTRNEHRTAIRPFPISIAFSGAEEKRPAPDAHPLEALGIGAERLLLGVDRLDYTKGILERFKAFEFLLDMHPRWREHATLLQIASPTRSSIPKYREYAAQVEAEARRINQRFATRAWKPIALEARNYSHDQLMPLYRRADVCLVTSLHDGMNLVAKEFAAARDDEAGVLILSQFTGASRDLKGALIVNPYSAEETASAIHEALSMPKAEQHRRMRSLRAAVRDYNVFRWSAEIIKALASLD